MNDLTILFQTHLEAEKTYRTSFRELLKVIVNDRETFTDKAILTSLQECGLSEKTSQSELKRIKRLIDTQD